jgi:hypothetical protein
LEFGSELFGFAMLWFAAINPINPLIDIISIVHSCSVSEPRAIINRDYDLLSTSLHLLSTCPGLGFHGTSTHGFQYNPSYRTWLAFASALSSIISHRNHVTAYATSRIRFSTMPNWITTVEG